MLSMELCSHARRPACSVPAASLRYLWAAHEGLYYQHLEKVPFRTTPNARSTRTHRQAHTHADPETHCTRARTHARTQTHANVSSGACLRSGGPRNSENWAGGSPAALGFETLADEESHSESVNRSLTPHCAALRSASCLPKLASLRPRSKACKLLRKAAQSKACLFGRQLTL